MSTIAIAGLGWLGLPLAAQLQELGHQVKGSVTSKNKQAELRNHGLEVYQKLPKMKYAEKYNPFSLMLKSSSS